MKKHIVIFNMKGEKNRLSGKLMCAAKGGLYITCTGLMSLEGEVCVCVCGCVCVGLCLCVTTVRELSSLVNKKKKKGLKNEYVLPIMSFTDTCS